MLEVLLDKTVDRFIEKLIKSKKTEDKNILAETLKIIDLLKENGNNLNYPHCRSFKNRKYKGIKLKELRILTEFVGYRIFYFIHDGKIAVLFSPSEKKSQKLSDSVIDNAFKKMKKLINDF